MKRWMMLAAVLLFALSAAATETDIKTVVKTLESEYGIHHHGVPFLWMAKPFTAGSGVSGLKIATFEDVQLPPEKLATVRQRVEAALGPEWFPFVETRQKDGEWTVIYAQPNGSGMRLLILTSEVSEVTVLQMNCSSKLRDEWVQKPVKSAKKHG